jgi:mannosylglycerate hydrolase
MPGKTHIKYIKVISNTHWDREFRRSFEKTRKDLIVMMDTILDILEKDPDYHSFTLDGHTILVDDYLEMRPEKAQQVKDMIAGGRIVIGPWYTLAEQFSISGEALVRNLLYGAKTISTYGGQRGTVAYTPASWGQTGQLPQILKGFGLDKMMFYRGISHHESDAEFIWQAPDGSKVLGNRFGLYARYNWYYQVHRAVTRNGRTFEKEYHWGEFDEQAMRFADSISGDDPSFYLVNPRVGLDTQYISEAIEKMIDAEGKHFTTPVFPAMHGHDISVAHPMETEIIKQAKELLGDKYQIAHTDLEGYWNEVVKHLDPTRLHVLKGERRSYLKTGMWTYLFPATISARTYLKQRDFLTTTKLVSYAEPLAALACSLGSHYPVSYLDRAWRYLLSNHTHDANGGCAPDAVCQDMEYRYRKTADISEIIAEQSMTYVAAHTASDPSEKASLQLVVFNPLPFENDAMVSVDLEMPASLKAQSVLIEKAGEGHVDMQPMYHEKSSVFVDNIWDVPTILDSDHLRFYALFRKLPPLGYNVYKIRPQPHALRKTSSLLTSVSSMENEFLAVQVNPNGTVTIRNKATGRVFENLNYISDQGETGNAWQHESPRNDQIVTSLGVASRNSVITEGPLVCTIRSEFVMRLPVDYGDGTCRSEQMTEVPICIDYTLEKPARYLKSIVPLQTMPKIIGSG